ncbi:hypothetical protein NC653_031974 [Populus alba x Populus x berolinensis]|uniref:DUF4283 domain-containing protein n=1 Tax=Populus alba x Populus x berolinensis TaxID=444605 RepID=A0AAD6M0U0_9ROSI|nr:hypothetical protein NC653_031974 [Populus alba x Populus x berolinensis]
MVTSGSSPDKFLILAEDGSSPQPVASSPSTPDHVLVEDCSDEDDYEDEIVDYSTSGCPTVTPSTGNNLDAAFNSASRVLPLNGPGHSAFPVTTSTKRSSPPVTALPQTSPGLVEEVPNVISSPTACPHSGAPQPPAPVEKWRDLFATNRSTTTGPKLPHFSASCNDLPCDLLSADLDNNYNLTFNMMRISYARVLVELNLLADLKSSIVINLPNGSTLNQPVIYETLPRFCTLCKVLGHKTGACTPPSKPVMARPVDKQNLPATITNKDRSVFDRLGPVEPNNAMGNKGSSQHAQQTLDPLQAEVEAVTGGWEVVKRKKSNARHKETSGPAAPQRVTSRDKEVACSNKGKEVACSMDVRVRGDESIAHPNISNEGRSAPAALSSGDTRPIIIHEKEPAGASTSRTNPNVVSVGIVNNRGKRRSSSRGSGGRVLPSSTNI